MHIMQAIQSIYYATGSVNTLNVMKQQKQAISRNWWLFLCAEATRLETVVSCLFTRRKIPIKMFPL